MKNKLIIQTREVNMDSFMRRLSLVSCSEFYDQNYVIYAVGNTYTKNNNIQLANDKWTFLKLKNNQGFIFSRPSYFLANINSHKYLLDFFEHVFDNVLIEFAIIPKSQEELFLEKYQSYSELSTHIDDFKDCVDHIVFGVDTDPTDVEDPDNLLEFISYGENEPTEIVSVL